MKYKLLVCTSAFLLLGSQAWAQTTGDTSKGKVWIDDKGMTLYTFDKDTSGKSTCNGPCAQNWPPLPAARACGWLPKVDTACSMPPAAPPSPVSAISIRA